MGGIDRGHSGGVERYQKIGVMGVRVLHAISSPLSSAVLLLYSSSLRTILKRHYLRVIGILIYLSF
jgi:hypothetical protein